MDDLMDFLLARVAEDERAAAHATPGAWQRVPVDDGTDGWDVLSGTPDGNRFDVAVDHARPTEGACGRSDAHHIARHQPARVLAECAAKRRVVEACRAVPAGQQQPYRAGLFMALRLLALPYADHPDHLEEWRA